MAFSTEQSKKIEYLELDVRAYKKTTARMAKEINDLTFKLNVEKRIHADYLKHAEKMEIKNDELQDKIDDLEADIADLMELNSK